MNTKTLALYAIIAICLFSLYESIQPQTGASSGVFIMQVFSAIIAGLAAFVLMKQGGNLK